MEGRRLPQNMFFASISVIIFSKEKSLNENILDQILYKKDPIQFFGIRYYGIATERGR